MRNYFMILSFKAAKALFSVSANHHYILKNSKLFFW